MSHSYGEVIKDGEIIGHYEYNGTSDIAGNRIYKTKEEVGANWRSKHSFDAECTCSVVHESAVILYSDYGYGFHWPATACLKCGVVLEGRGAYDIDTISGHPLPNYTRES